MHFLSTGKLQALRFPTFWFENTPQGKFVLNLAFGQSQYFIDHLAESVQRGLREKLRRGEFPGWAPVGYLNNQREHSIEVDEAKPARAGRGDHAGGWVVPDTRSVEGTVSPASMSRAFRPWAGRHARRDHLERCPG